MNDQEKALARRLLESKTLSIEQVEKLRAESESTGRSFADLVKPHLGGSAPNRFRLLTLQPLYLGLLAASFLIFAGLLIATLSKMQERSRKDDDLALETERSRADSDRKSMEASIGYQRSLVTNREAAAKEHLERARAAMKWVEARPAGAPPTPELALQLNEAFIGFNMYLEVLPDDAAVRVERARTHELRRNYDKAIADLERAIELRKDLEPALRDRIIQLRLFLSKNPR